MPWQVGAKGCDLAEKGLIRAHFTPAKSQVGHSIPCNLDLPCHTGISWSLPRRDKQRFRRYFLDSYT